MATSLLQRLVQSIADMPAKFADVAMADPVAAVMLAVGGLVMLVTIGYMSLLALGAVASLVNPGGGGRTHPPTR